MGATFSQYLSMAIYELKESVIGIFKDGKDYYMITKYNEESGTINTVRFGQLGGMQYDYGLPTERGTFKLFPEGKTMNDMQDDIKAWSDFYNEL